MERQVQPECRRSFGYAVVCPCTRGGLTKVERRPGKNAGCLCRGRRDGDPQRLPLNMSVAYQGNCATRDKS